MVATKQKKDNKGRFTKNTETKNKPKKNGDTHSEKSTIIEEEQNETPLYKDDGGSLHLVESEEVNNNRNTSHGDDKH